MRHSRLLTATITKTSNKNFEKNLRVLNYEGNKPCTITAGRGLRIRGADEYIAAAVVNQSGHQSAQSGGIDPVIVGDQYIRQGIVELNLAGCGLVIVFCVLLSKPGRQVAPCVHRAVPNQMTTLKAGMRLLNTHDNDDDGNEVCV